MDFAYKCDDFQTLLKDHGWFYHFSDSHSVQLAGERREQAIADKVRAQPELLKNLVAYIDEKGSEFSHAATLFVSQLKLELDPTTKTAAEIEAAFGK